jgi:putative protein kinase ArgK-like GTPase of G3E family
VTTALSGEGIPALLAEIDRQRGPAHASGAARAARAEAQVWAILAERTRAELERPETRAASREVLDAVATHALDPFAAADRLLALLAR